MTGSFSASANGFAFANRWPHVPPLRFRVGGPVPLELAIGDAANGLCGGMASRPSTCGWQGYGPPADPLPPAEGTPAFRYLVRRQLDSFELGLGPARFYLLGAPWRSAASRSRRGAGPRIAPHPARAGGGPAGADRPRPCRLRQPGDADPGPPGRGLRNRGRPGPGSLSLRIYDPNLPGDDTVRLVIRRQADPGGGVELTYSPGPPVVAFFRQGYRPRDPLPWR